MRTLNQSTYTLGRNNETLEFRKPNGNNKNRKFNKKRKFLVIRL